MEGLASASLEVRATALAHSTIAAVWRVVRTSYVRRYEVLSVALGLVLVGTAWLKGLALAVYGAVGVGIFSSIWVQVGICLLEWLFGLWLISRRAPETTRGLAFLFFAALSYIAGWSALSGAASCPGCLGRYSANPWAMLVFDIFALIAIALCPPHQAADLQAAKPGMITRLTRQMLVSLAGVGILFGIVVLSFGSLFPLFNWLRGERVAITPCVVELADCPKGEHCVSELRVSNGTDAAIELVGGTTTCTCVVTDGLPLRVPPGQEQSIPIRVLPPGQPGQRFAHTVRIYVKGHSLRPLNGQIRGRVTKRKEVALSGQQLSPIRTSTSLVILSD